MFAMNARVRGVIVRRRAYGAERALLKISMPTPISEIVGGQGAIWRPTRRQHDEATHRRGRREPPSWPTAARVLDDRSSPHWDDEPVTIDATLDADALTVAAGRGREREQTGGMPWLFKLSVRFRRPTSAL